MGVAGQTLPPVQHHRIKTADPERAQAFIGQNYSEYVMRFSGNPKEFIFAQTVTSAQGFSVGRMRHSMAVKADTDSIGGQLVIAQVLSGRLEYGVGQETIRTSRTQPVLLPPSRSFQATCDNFGAGFVVLDPVMVAEYAASVGGIQSAGLKFAGMKPVSPSMALHRQSVVGHM